MMGKNKLPIHDKSGVLVSQKVAENDSESQAMKPLDGLHMAKTINGLAVSHSRSLGGEVTSALIAGVTNQMACDFKELKDKHETLSIRFETQRDELERTRTKKAVLVERIRSEGKNKNLRNFGIAIGTSLIGTGIFLSRTELDMYSLGAYGFGAILLILSWISGPKEAEE